MKPALVLFAVFLALLLGMAARVQAKPSRPIPDVWRVKLGQHERLRVENQRLRQHVKGYKVWVRKLRRENRHLRRESNWYAESVQAIRMAALAYGQNASTLLRKADCESGFWPYADNPRSDATGLFQFLYPSTWRSTPFASFSPWNVYAQALAASWMHKVGRGNEWSCR